MPKLKLTIATPEKKVLEEEIESITLPTIDGEITILPHHLALTTVLKAGELVVRTGGETKPFAIGGGFAEIQSGSVTILADTAEGVAEIDEQKAEEARQRAKVLMEEKRNDAEEYALVAAKLERDLARLRIVRKYRHKGHHGVTQETVFKE